MKELKNYPRDMIGYGNNPINPKWPNNAKIALQFVLNYEEGGENCILHGDEGSETFLSDMFQPPSYKNQRHQSIETLYEYGSRVGVWRVLNLFKSYEIPITVFAIATALQKNPLVSEYFASHNYDICSHGYKWINYQNISKDIEEEHFYKSIEIIQKITGKRPNGWYTGRDSQYTRELVLREGGFLYDSDAYNDDLPYFINGFNNNQHLVIPYTLDTNDMRFVPPGFSYSEQFFQYLKDSFDALYYEGQNGAPKMMNIGMHCRLSGKPGRIVAMKKFLEYISKFDDVWFASRSDIAKHWIKNFKKTDKTV